MITRSHHRSVAALAGAAFLCLTVGFANPQADSRGEAVRLRLELDRPVLPAGSMQRAVIKVSFDGVRLVRSETRPPVNLSLVIDRSGSMNGEKIEKAKAAAIAAVRRLGPEDVFSLVTYNNRVETLVAARSVGNCAGLEEAIRSIHAGGGTALYGGVAQGAAELRKFTEDPRYVHRLILLSDGLANVGPSSPDDLARLGGSLLREGISVTTIGVGLDYNEDLMTRLAQRSDGNTYFVASSRDLVGIFNAELGDVLSVVARRVVLSIEFPEGVRPLAFVGREGSIRGQHAEVALNQLYAGQEKFALVEVEIEPSMTGDGREVAWARLTYDDPLDHRSVTLRAKGRVAFTAIERDVLVSANHRVQADYARNITAMAKDAAVALVDDDRRDEAARVLRQRSAELEAMARVYGNADVQAMVVANKQEADRLESAGLDKAARKTYRAESAQIRNQQSGSTRP